MKDSNSRNSKIPIRHIYFSTLTCILILTVGILGMAKLAGSKAPPTESKKEERALMVEAVLVEPEDVPIVITGYGEVQTLKAVVISPEVSGTLIEVHPRLDAGEIIPKGEVLFRVDTRNYDAAKKEARATVVQCKNAINRLKKQSAIDLQRLKTLERNRELAKQEFQRLKNLYCDYKVGTRSGVDKMEQAFNAAMDRVDQMNQTLVLYPLQINEAQSGLASAQVRLEMAQVNLTRCAVRADFDARVKSVAMEQGQYVAPGQPVLTIADDSVLEIQVPVDSRDARQWIQFNGRQDQRGAWFNDLEPVACSIHWTEDADNHTWRGRLHRVVRFDPQTRTLILAVRISSEDAAGNGSGGLPLAEGMFCAVEIPGTTLRNVYRLPIWAVSYDNYVYLARDNRLETVPVKVARMQGETAIISDGLQPGDLAVTTRLSDPLENTLLDVTTINTQGS